MIEFTQGYNACKKSRGIRVANPYSDPTQANRWEDGWAAAMEEIKSDEE